jgi:pyrroline-5-carboxylate reductase
MAGDLIALPGPLVLVGCGKMGGALLRGWLSSGVLASHVTVVEPIPSASDDIVGKGVRVVASPGQLPSDLRPAVVVLAIKPQFMEEGVPPYGRFAGPDAVFLSIAAGKTTAYLRQKLGPKSLIVRAMPNTPAAVGRGMSVIVRDSAVPGPLQDLCGRLLSVVGKVAWIDDEDAINAVTALSGGGPAYVFLLIEALAQAGRKQGLAPDLAMTLARETVCGAGELAYRSDETPEAMRRAVTSPKGTTLEALNILMAEDGLQQLMDRAIDAATKRSRAIAEGK